MLELAHQGAQVMQVRAVELGWVNDVVIEVLSSFEDAPGTLIREDPLVEQRNKVRGLAHDRNVAKVTIVDVPDRPGVAKAIFEPLAEAGVNVDMIVQNVGHGGATDMSFTVPRAELARGKKVLDPVVRELGARELTTDASVGKVSIVGAGLHNAPGLRRADVRDARRRRREHRDDLDVGGADHLHRRRGRARDGPARAPRRLRARAAGGGRRRRGGLRRSARVPWTDSSPGRERFAVVGSTNDVVRDWLADRHARGLPRDRRRADGRPRAATAAAGWRRPAPPLLLSLGFRPTWLDPDRAWRLAATVSLAMADAAEEVAGLPDGTIRLKWPNDLVVETPAGTSAVAGAHGPAATMPPTPARPSARSPASSARPTAWARTTRGSSSASASTRTGPRPTSRPNWHRP